jgi:hypothetical protein
MKRVLLSALLLGAVVFGHAQSWFPFQYEIKEKYSSEDWTHWLKKPTNGQIWKICDLTPVAISDAISDIKYILSKTGTDYDDPQLDESFYYNEDEKNDIALLYASVHLDFSSVSKGWVTPDGYFVFLNIRKNYVSMAVRKKTDDINQ